MKQMRAGKTLTIREIQITPVERVRISASMTGNVVWLSGSCEPVALILKNGDQRWVLSVAGDTMESVHWVDGN